MGQSIYWRDDQVWCGDRSRPSEEAYQALIILDVADAIIEDALDRATHGMLQRLSQSESDDNMHGVYCCGLCLVAYWRHVMVGGLNGNEERLAAAMKRSLCDG